MMSDRSWIVVGGFVLLVLGGCSSSEDDQSEAKASAAPRHTESLADPGNADDVDRPDAATSVPDEHREDMAELARGLGITDPPDVDPVRAITREEQPFVMADCLTQAGFPSEADPSDGSWGTRANQDQLEAMRLAEFTCLGQYPLMERYTATWDEEQLTVQYDWLRDEVLPCMQDLGYPTPVMPTQEVFVAMYAEQGRLWFPDGELDRDTIAADMGRVMEECEVFPPDEVLYGSG